MDGQIFSLHFHSSREEGTGCVVLYGLMPPCPLSECEIKRVRLGSLNGWIGRWPQWGSFLFIQLPPRQTGWGGNRQAVCQNNICRYFRDEMRLRNWFGKCVFTVKEWKAALENNMTNLWLTSERWARQCRTRRRQKESEDSYLRGNEGWSEVSFMGDRSYGVDHHFGWIFDG